MVFYVIYGTRSYLLWKEREGENAFFFLIHLREKGIPPQTLLCKRDRIGGKPFYFLFLLLIKSHYCVLLFFRRFRGNGSNKKYEINTSRTKRAFDRKHSNGNGRDRELGTAPLSQFKKKNRRG